MKIVTRKQWGARPARSRSTLSNPTGMTTHWEGVKVGKLDHGRCAGVVREIQRFHMDGRGWVDVAYSALVCQHGYVFEGRWLGVRTAANGTNAGNRAHYAVCVMAGPGDTITPAAKAGVADTYAYFRAHSAGPEAKCHRDWKPTMCPGDELCGFVRAGLPGASTKPTPADPPSAPQPTPAPAGRWLRLGDRGGHVPKLQAMLNALSPDSADVRVDGVFGRRTDAQVRTLQAFFGLGVDGVVGPQTSALIFALLSSGSDARRVPATTIGRGDSGDDVEKWQRLLNAVSDVDVATDGDFGPATEAATKAFQRWFGLAADGVVGPRTRAVAVNVAVRG